MPSNEFTAVEVHVLTTTGHCHKFKNCTVTFSLDGFVILENNAVTYFPMHAVECFSSLESLHVVL